VPYRDGYPPGAVEDSPACQPHQGQIRRASSAAVSATNAFPSRWPPDGCGKPPSPSHYERAKKLAPVRSNRVRMAAFFPMTWHRPAAKRAGRKPWAGPALEAVSLKWTGCRSFPKLYLWPQEGDRGGNGSSRRRRGSAKPTFPCSGHPSHTGGVTALNGLIKPEAAFRIGRRHPASRRRECLSPCTRQRHRSRRSTGTRRACVSGATA